jgi:hypothetical protein
LIDFLTKERSKMKSDRIEMGGRKKERDRERESDKK